MYCSAWRNSFDFTLHATYVHCMVHGAPDYLLSIKEEQAPFKCSELGHNLMPLLKKSVLD